MDAQSLYDWRKETGEIGHTDLELLFQELTGDPSPRGRTAIDVDKLARIASEGAQMGEWASAILRHFGN